MLETEMKKLTAAIEALTAAMTPQFNLKDNEPVVEEPVAEPVKAAPATPTKAAPPVSDVDFSQAGKAQET